MSRRITKIEAPMSMPVIKRVAAYARVSCDKNDMLHSLAAQVSAYSERIQNHPEWAYVGVYADEALTGTTAARPEFQRLLADCQSGLIDMVVTKSISRFARNTVTLLETVRMLKERSIDVFFEEQNIHTMSSDGELMLTILASYAQEESRSVSENCKWHIRKSYKEGRFTNHIQVYGFDFQDGRLIPNPREAEVVRMIFTDYLSGLGKNAIMRKLTKLGIPTKRGGAWSENTVISILKNEKYVGDIIHQKGFIADHLSKRWMPNQGQFPQYLVENAHEPIVCREDFNAVQVEMQKRAKKARQSVQPTFSEFTGFIRCERCGANFGRKVNAIGTKYAKALWACSSYTRKGKQACPAKRIPEDILKEKCAEAMGSEAYEPEKFKEIVTAITVPSDGVLVFFLRDGTRRTVCWENRSRSESWTNDMKQAARERALRGGSNSG